MFLRTVILVLIHVAAIGAYPSFRNSIPNGYVVPNPCDLNEIQLQSWSGVGHVGSNPNRGGHGLNAFGRAFNRHGRRFTRALCLEDSDGDGRNNGLELGVVNCNNPTVVDPSAKVTHPGICEPVESAACQRQNRFLDTTNCAKLKQAAETGTGTGTDNGNGNTDLVWTVRRGCVCYCIGGSAVDNFYYDDLENSHEGDHDSHEGSHSSHEGGSGSHEGSHGSHEGSHGSHEGGYGSHESSEATGSGGEEMDDWKMPPINETVEFTQPDKFDTRFPCICACEKPQQNRRRRRHALFDTN